MEEKVLGDLVGKVMIESSNLKETAARREEDPHRQMVRATVHKHSDFSHTHSQTY